MHKTNFHEVVFGEDVLFVAPLGTCKTFFHELVAIEDVLSLVPRGTRKSLFHKVVSSCPELLLVHV